jgi:RNA polymerase sigma-70 factor (ECF subfamily)
MRSSEEELLNRWQQGDGQALGELFTLHRDRLGRSIRFRLDPRLHGRLDPEDVLQEAYLAAVQRAHHYLGNPTHSVFVWLRMIVNQTLTDLHRQHLAAQMRDATREVSLQPRNVQPLNSASLVFQLVGSFTSPSQAAIRAELAKQLQQALEQMNQTDREVLALRHYEELTNNEVAEVLHIEPKAASIRYVRAIRRLKEILGQVEDLFQNPGLPAKPSGGKRAEEKKR